MEPGTYDRLRRLRTVIAVATVIIAATVLLESATSSPRLCGSCHGTAGAHQAWSESAHAGVECVSCHGSDRPWYAVPLTLAERGGLLGRDLWWQTVGRSGNGAEGETDASAADSMGDEVCLRCHDPNRKATSGFRILIDHAEHARRNGTCVACHLDTAHPEPARGRALSLMARCYRCHGTAEQPEASDDCATCHPGDFELRPVSHEETAWRADHGFVSASDPAQCRMCHEQRDCDDCHGVEMPHPEEWVSGPAGHAVPGKDEPGVCEQCHTQKPDPCSTCHHEAYIRPAGTWLESHPVVAREEGVESCMSCHDPRWCASCHRRPEGLFPG